MPRSRNIKPGICTNEYLSELPYEARFLFAVLPCFADRRGRLEDRPKKVKIQVFPGDSINTDMVLQSLHDACMVLRYEVDKRRYIQILNFERHQNPHRDEVESVIPEPTEEQLSTMQAPWLHDAKPADSFIPITDSCIPQQTVVKKKPKTVKGYTEDFERVWKKRPGRSGDSKADAFKAFKARLKAGATVQELEEGLERYVAHLVATETEMQFTKTTATFFGPGEHYKDNWFTPEKRNGRNQTPKRSAAERAAIDAAIGHTDTGIDDIPF